jgi:branched-chain amino acid transport system substrate-binding protein
MMLRRNILLLAAAAIGLATASAVAQPAPIKIGVIVSYSGGDNVAIGKLVDAAFATYMKQHGDTIAGRKIELVKRDDTGIAPDTARRLAQELIVQDKVDMLIGGVYTPNVIAIAGVSTQAKKPYFIINSATSNIIAKNPYSARFGFTTAQITVPLAKWAYKQGYRTAYAVFQDYGPGIDAGAAFVKTFEAEGGKMLGESRIPINNQDFSAYIQRVKDTKPQVMFVFINATGGGTQFLKAVKEAGIDKAGVKLLATGDIVDEPILQQSGDAAMGVITTFDYSSWHGSRTNQDFLKAFQAANSTSDRPNFVAVAAYDAIAAAYKVIEAQKGQIDPDKTMELIKGYRWESPRGPAMIDAATRDIVQNVYLRRTERRGTLLQNTEFETFPMQKDPNEQ